MPERPLHSVRGVDCVSWHPTGAGPAADRGNAGDRLGPVIVDALAARIAGPLDPTSARAVLAVGSILHFAAQADIVWGAGVNGKVSRGALPPWLDVRAVRGPWTRAALLARGIPTPEVYGDPAMLLPEVRPEVLDWSRTKRREVLVVPNLNELDRFEGTEVRSPLGDPWEFVKDIAESEFVTGTSLHALVVADALGVPSRPIRSAVEHPMKYLDHYASTGRPRTRFAQDVGEALRMGPVDAPDFDPRPLLDAFPADAWLGTLPPESSSGARVVETIALSRDALDELRPTASDAAGEACLEAVERFAAIGPHRDGLTGEEVAELGLPPHEEATDAPRPTLSVVVPAHNVAAWVDETMASLLGQQFADLEIVVVDDHSTDGTRARLAAMAAADPRVRVIDAVSRGGGTARNVGIDRARGRYLAFSDADDLVPEGAYRALVDSLESSGSDIAFGDFLKFSPVSTWHPTAGWPDYRERLSGVGLREHPTLIYGRACWNKVFRRSTWDAAGIRFPDVPRSNDIVPMTTAYLAAGHVDVVPEFAYLYRDRPGASSMTAKAESATSLLSYLGQELACARMVHDDGADQLRDRYAALILDRDGWVHLTRYLRSATRDRETEVLDGFRELVGLLGRSPDRLRDRSRRLVWHLALEGRAALAAAVCSAATGPEPAAADRVAAWLDVLRLQEGGDVDVLDRRWWLRDRVVEAIARGIVEGGPESDADVLALARAVERVDPRLLLAVPELAHGDLDDPALREAFASTRAIGARVAQVDTGRRIRASVRTEDVQPVEPVLFDEVRGRATAGAARIGADGAHELSVGRAGLRRGHRHRIAVRDPKSGRLHSAWGRPITPEYDPYDAFTLGIDRRGVALTPRLHWSVRAARKAVQRIVPGSRPADDAG